jgi:regulator of protease activity HflC (stomatin/prohibitin superfamily)
MCNDCEDNCCGLGLPGIIGGIIVFIGLLLTVVLVPLSLKTVNFDEVAVEYNKVTRNMGDEVLGEGLHDVGPAGELLTFKTTQREGKVNRMPALSADSIELRLDVNVFYSIIKAEVFLILEKFGDQDGHDAFITSFTSAVVRDVAAQFTAKQFYLQRQDFQQAVQRTLTTRFAAAAAHATVDSVQVLDITLPSTVLKAMEASTVAEQDIQNAISERATKLQAAQIALDLAQSEAGLILIEAARDVAVIEQAAQQAILVEREKMQTRADAFSNISLGLGFGGEFFVESYLKYLVTQSNTGNTVVGV